MKLSERKRIWDLEAIYLRAHLTADHEPLLTLIHPDFAMRTSTGSIVRADGVAAYLSDNYGKPRDLNFELTPEHIGISGNTAIVHYNAAFFRIGDDEKKPLSILKSMHVWQKMDGDWLLMGGMNSS